ncbi:MAG TPA: response regulator [Thermoanaerobaculia bacterium]|nr:response regulator [Thermoanaerobaculia bacterium]
MAKKILLADDSITIQKVVELTFSDGDFEVVAVNNGSKAIQKMQESRPDIILSDIIMPEKNGYEVCEYVKSHPDLRNIPVILLTGTFEPFDPDRAERAGCDAVVTKPFESQSLIHKVEELIQQSAGSTASSPAPATPPPSPFDETSAERRAEPPAADAMPAAEPESDPFGESSPADAAPDQPTPEEIFGSPPVTRDQPAEDRREPLRPESPPPSRFSEAPDAGAAPSEGTESAETTAFPKMGVGDPEGDRQEPASASEPEPEEEAEPPQDEGWSAATTAFPKVTFDELQKMREAAQEQQPADLPWQTATEPSGEEGIEWPRPGSEPAEQRSFPSPPESGGAKGFGFDSPATPDDSDAMAFEPPEPPKLEEPVEPRSGSDDEDLAWTRPQAVPDTPAEEPVPMLERGAGEGGAEAASGELTDDQVDRIARRIVEIIGEKAVRDVAWEVIPDLAQSLVRERIKQLESED